MTVMSDHNIRLLNDIKNKVQDVCKTYKYEFKDDKNLHSFKTSMIDSIINASQNRLITKEINKTEMPDDCILLILRNQGCEINSIYDLIEVSQEWKYDEDKKIIHLYTHPTFRLNHIMLEFRLNPSNPEV